MLVKMLSTLAKVFRMRLSICMAAKIKSNLTDQLREQRLPFHNNSRRVALILIISPHEYPVLASSSGSWDWDRDTIVKAQGMKSALSSFQMISVFIITKDILDMVKSLAKSSNC